VIVRMASTFNTRVYLLITALIFLSIFTQTIHAAPANKLLVFWAGSNESNTETINHTAWQSLLNNYLISNHPSGINRFNYEAVSDIDHKKLRDYLSKMQQLDPRAYNRAEQKAYWINLYNALTIELILKDYPVESITKLGKSYFSFGPWDDKVTNIQNKSLSLNKIEHGILRPIFRDNRIHYAVNCASISCPNLAVKAYTAENTDQLLDLGARQYVNHPRGVTFEEGTLKVSSIYHWYKVDFGNNDKTLINHLIKYAKPKLATKLQNYQDDIDHHYDWNLNKP
jgi:Protein of unknown function, DUF547